MRILFLLVLSSLLNVLNAQVSFAQDQFIIKEIIKKSYNGADISCAGKKDGEFKVIVSGGSGNYKYSKDNGATYQNGNVFSNLGVGSYNVIVVDKEIFSNNPPRITVNLANSLNPVTISSNLQIISQPKCFSSADGIISLTAWGGTGDLMYSIDNGGTFQNSGRFEGVDAGIYKVFIKDLNGCNVTSNAVTLKGPAEIKVDVKSKSNSTCSNPYGSITLRGTGSTGDYNYSLDGESFFWKAKNDYHTFSNLSTGSHQLLVKDNFNQCTITYNFEITTIISATLSGSTTLCQGENANLQINIDRTEGVSISKDTYTVTYKDDSEKTYTISNLVKGKNTISLGQWPASNTFTLLSLVSSSGCSGSVAGSATITVNPSGTWLGVNTNWHDSKNWTCGKVPTPSTNVTIGQTKNDPQIINQTAFANNLTILKGASLKTNNTIQIFGTISNSGFFDATTGALEFKGENIQTISGSFFKNKTIGNLVVSNTAGLEISKVAGDTLNITGNLTFGTETASLNTGDNITLKSSMQGTANVGVVNPGNRISGKFIVERYVNTGTNKSLGQHGKAWMLLATPTKGSTLFESWQEGGKATGKTPIANTLNGFGTLLTTGYNSVPANGFDLYTGAGPSIKTYVSATGNYDKGPANTNENIYNENGYMVMVRGDRTIFTSTAAANPVVLRTKGEIITGTTTAIKVPANKFASIGNPYASKIYINNIQMDGVDEFISVWDPKLGGTYGLGAFQTLYKNGANYYAIPGGGSYARGPVTFIESGQAFFVQTTKTEGSVYFTEDAKVATGTSKFQRGGAITSDVSSLSANLYALGSGEAVLADGTMLLTGESFSNKIDGRDARKMANSAENFSILSSGSNLALESRQAITSNDTLFFNMTGMRAQNYRLELAAENLGMPGMEAFLEDNFLKTKTPVRLSDSTLIDFAVTNQAGAAAANRFSIIFRPAGILPVTFTEVKATKSQENILVEWKVESESNLKQYEVEKSLNGNSFSKAGTVSAEKTKGGNYQWLDKSPAAGFNYYRIRSVDLDGKTSLTQIVKVQTEAAPGTISVYPNPIANGVLNLQLGNQPEGIYNLRLLNPVGQVLLSKKINHAGGNHTEKINWDHSLPKGMYTLEISNEQTGVKIIKVMY